jgi:hypothetical protein
MLNYILTTNACTLFLDGKIHTIGKQKPAVWERFYEALKKADLETIRQLVDKSTALINYTNGVFEIKDNVVYYRGVTVDNSLTRRVVNMMEEGFDIQPMVNFIGNLMNNPSNRAVEELYNFLEVCDLPITPDGQFIAYKRVRANYMDVHSGTIRNQVGDKPFMLRNQVDDNKERTCSHGLHVCSINYLTNFSGERLMVVKVNPRDVVSIPVDYNNSKMRVCEYEVIQEIDMATVEAFQRDLPAIYNARLDEDDEGYNDDDDNIPDYDDDDPRIWDRI